MIDTCLQRDPERRPSAEKLLQHPIFKNAKKRAFLVTNMLKDLPPLDQRLGRSIFVFVDVRERGSTKIDSKDDFMGL